MRGMPRMNVHRCQGMYVFTRTSAILVYGDRLRCSLFTNHAHTFGPDHACSELQIEGTSGAAFAQMGVNLDYPRGRPDELAFALRASQPDGRRASTNDRAERASKTPRRARSSTRSPSARAGWRSVPLVGSWFPDAFIGTMSNLQRFAAGEDAALVSPVEDAFQTMLLVEACYRSDAEGGISMQAQ